MRVEHQCVRISGVFVLSAMSTNVKDRNKKVLHLEMFYERLYYYERLYLFILRELFFNKANFYIYPS